MDPLTCIEEARVVCGRSNQDPAVEVIFKDGSCPRQQKAALFALASKAQMAFLQEEFDVIIKGNRIKLDVKEWPYESDVERALHTFLTVARGLP